MIAAIGGWFDRYVSFALGGGYTDDGSEKIAELADEHLFWFLYPLTESQDLARAYTPCVVNFLGFDGTSRFQYRGKLDNRRTELWVERYPNLLNAMKEIKNMGEYSGTQLPLRDLSSRHVPQTAQKSS